MSDSDDEELPPAIQPRKLGPEGRTDTNVGVGPNDGFIPAAARVAAEVGIEYKKQRNELKQMGENDKPSGGKKNKSSKKRKSNKKRSKSSKKRKSHKRH